MQRGPIYIVHRRKTMNPVLQVLAALVGLGLTAIFFMLGLVFFAVFAGIALVVGLVIWIRLRWFQHKAEKANPEGVERVRRSRDAPSHDSIEGEYEVLRDRDRD